MTTLVERLLGRLLRLAPAVLLSAPAALVLAWRLDLDRREPWPSSRWAARRGGQAGLWPWFEIVIPRVGSLVLSRRYPRASP